MNDWTQAFVALGSNLGDKQAHLDAAIAGLSAHPGIENLAESPRYETDPMGPQDQPNYLNSACRFLTELAPHKLLDVLQAIEIDRGRDRPSHADAIAALRWQARTLDLDLLMYGDEHINDERLTVPHIGIADRHFVLQPLFDLNPEIHVPGLGPVAELLARQNVKLGCESH